MSYLLYYAWEIDEEREFIYKRVQCGGTTSERSIRTIYDNDFYVKVLFYVCFPLRRLIHTYVLGVFFIYEYE